MDRRSTLHWSAILLALFAASWMLISFVGALVFLLPLFGLAGFILALVSTKHLDAQSQPPVRSGSIFGIALYGLWILLSLAALPVAIKNVGSYTPPQFLGDLATALATVLAGLGAIAVLWTFWRLWDRRAQIIGAIGTAIVVLITLLDVTGTTPTGETAGTLIEFGFPLAFLLLLIAILIPLFAPDDAHAAWNTGATA